MGIKASFFHHGSIMDTGQRLPNSQQVAGQETWFATCFFASFLEMSIIYVKIIYYGLRNCNSDMVKKVCLLFQ